jgi:Ca-activated chloride channel family protein
MQRKGKFLIASVAIALALSGCTNSNNTPDPNDFGDLKGCTPVVAAVSSEKVNLFTELANRFKDSPEGKALSTCAAIVPRDVASGEAARLLKLGWPSDQTDKPRPAIWSPASKSWVDNVADSQGAALVPNPTSFARTPVVIAMPERMAKTLGWPDKPIGLRDLHDLCLDPQGWGKFGGASSIWGKFKLGKTNPNTSTTGLNVLLMQNYTAAGKTKELTEADVAAGAQFSKELESCVIHYGDTTGNVLDRVYKRDQNSQGLNYVSAIAVEETSVINYNLGNPTSRVVKADEQLTKPKERLVAIYPSEGSLESDNPIVALGAPADWVTPEQRTAAEAFAKFVQTPAAQSVLGDFGFRPLDPAAKPGGLVTAEYGVDPAKPTTLLEKPSVPVVSSATSQWEDVRKPSSVRELIDISGSMRESAGEGMNMSRMDGAIASAVDTLDHFRPSDEVGVSAFTTDIPNNIAELRAVKPLGGDRENLAAEIKKLVPMNGTPLYDVISQAQKDMKKNAQPGRINAIIVLTDGQDSGSRISLDDLKRQLRGPDEGDDPAPVRVFPIIYGGEASPDALRQIAEASGGQVFNAADPRRINLVFRSVVNNF